MVKPHITGRGLAQAEASSKKRPTPSVVSTAQSRKRPRNLLEDDGSYQQSGATSPQGGVSIERSESFSSGDGFNINREFARRFEHNKNREELHRC